MCYNEKKTLKRRLWENIAQFGTALITVLVGVVAVASVLIVVIAIIDVMTDNECTQNAMLHSGESKTMGSRHIIIPDEQTMQEIKEMAKEEPIMVIQKKDFEELLKKLKEMQGGNTQ